jgi:Coenzyme PQQ synthesis protein D (PqqD)
MARRDRGISGETKVSASPNLLWCDLVREVAVLHPASGKSFLLQAVGAVVWRLLQEPKSVDDLASSLAALYDVEPARCGEDLRELVESLAREDLVVLRGPRDP